MNKQQDQPNELKITTSNGNVVTCPHCGQEYYEQQVGKQGEKSSDIGLYHYCIDGCQKQFDVIWDFEA